MLTAFLIESYKNLQEDPQQTMIQLLRDISAQTRSYTISAGVLNTTAPLSTVVPFCAAISDVRVNVCWFASLVLSLATASYSILVKQWLREYLAVDRTVPEERIRIRHFRYYGLEEWKLFEIAAALPLILHVSLALFFVGLCFFTAGVHPSIRTTSVSLVSGWAAFFIFFLLAPVLSPRCPYKTTFLKSVLRRVRPHVIAVGRSLARFNGSTVKPGMTRMLHSLWSVCASIPSFIRTMGPMPTIRGIRQYSWRSSILDFGSFVRHSVVVASVQLSALFLTVSRYILRFLEDIGGCFSCRLPWLRRGTVSAVSRKDVGETPTGDPRIHSRFAEKDIKIDAQHVAFFILGNHNLVDSTTLLEEDEVRGTEEHDLVILRQVDFILLDDHVLEMMRGALERRPPLGVKVLQFVVSAIRYRLGVPLHVAKQNSPTIPPFASLEVLSPSTRVSLANILADSVLRELTKITVDEWQNNKVNWMDDSLLLIFALVPRQYPISSPVRSVFKQLLQPNSIGKDPGCILLATRVIAQAAGYFTSHEWQAHVLACLVEPLKVLDYATLRRIVHRGYVDTDHRDVRYDSDTFGLVLKKVHQLSPEEHSIATIVPETLIVLVEVAAAILHTVFLSMKATSTERRDEPIPRPPRQLLEFVLEAVAVIDQVGYSSVGLKKPSLVGGIGLDKVFTEFLTTPALVETTLDCLSTRSHVLLARGSRNLLHIPLKGAYLVHKLSRKRLHRLRFYVAM